LIIKMSNTTCAQLRLELDEIKALKKDFNLAFTVFVRNREDNEVLRLQSEIKERVNLMRNILPYNEIEVFWQFAANEITAGNKINILESINEWQEFYRKHDLPEPDRAEVRQIWREHYQEIKIEMEKYGYDMVLIVPGEMPDSKKVREKMTKDEEIYLSDQFRQAGDFDSLTDVASNKTRIMLCHSDEKIHENEKANGILKLTTMMNLSQIVSLSDQEVYKLMKERKPIPVNFEVKADGEKLRVLAEGFSIDEYLLLQNFNFDKNGRYLDNECWSWCLKSYFDAHIVSSGRSFDDDKFYVDADDLTLRSDELACRFCRNFS
jgi:hypothetical protein